jgi:ribosomal protein S18 acetylase RimI-like enzyme
MGLVAVAPEYRGKGVNSIMMNEIFATLVKKKIISVESNLQLETNQAILDMFDGYGREMIKKRRCYMYHLPKV